MAKKSVRKSSKKEFDFFFLVVVSVFAAITMLAAGYLTQTKQEMAARQSALDVAQLDVVDVVEAEASPLPTANPPKYKNPTTKK